MNRAQCVVIPIRDVITVTEMATHDEHPVRTLREGTEYMGKIYSS